MVSLLVYLLVDEGGVCLRLLPVTLHRALECVDDVVVRVMLIVVQHTVIRVFLHSAQKTRALARNQSSSVTEYKRFTF